MKNLFLCTTVLLTSTSLYAGGSLSEGNRKALEKTQQLLTTKQQREAYLRDNPKAKKSDAMVNKLVHSDAQKEATYEIASEIFREIATENSGDAGKMNQLLLDGSKNPEAFFNNLSEENKRRIQELSKQLSPDKPAQN